MIQELALFDFDGTLVKCDSMALFARRVCHGSSLKLARMLMPFVPGYVASKACRQLRGKLKQQILVKLVREIPRDTDWDEFISTFIGLLDNYIIPETMACMESHLKSGHIVAIVSASPSLWVSPWASSHNVKNVIATEPAVDNSGNIIGFSGANCNYEEKVRRINEYFGFSPTVLNDTKSRPHIVAYGNSSADIPMLRMADEGYMVKRNLFNNSYEIKRYK